MSNMTIPLNSFVNTADDFIITDLETQEKDVLNKKNTLKYRNTLAPMYRKSEAKVFTTSGHKIKRVDNKTLQDENGRTYSVDNSFVIDSVVDITSLWSGKLTSAQSKDDLVYSVWQGERDFTIVVSDFDNNILFHTTTEVDQTDLLYYNIKLANYTHNAALNNTEDFYLVLQIVKTTSETDIIVFTVDNEAVLTEHYNYNLAYLTGRDLYVLAYYNNNEVKLATGFDDTDLRKRFTIVNNNEKVYKYWGCLGANGLMTGEPVLQAVSDRDTSLISDKIISQDDFDYLPNGLAYSQQIIGGTDAEDITANASLSSTTLSSKDGATTWGSITHTRETKAIVAGMDLEQDIPLILSPNYSPNSSIENVKSDIISLDEAYYVAPAVEGDNLAVEQIDFTDAWGNVTWESGTVAEITNGCNPFPYKYMIMNRAESKGRYWDYGPGWVRCYFRQGVIKSFDGANSKWVRAFAEKFPTSIISFGLSSVSNKNSVRIEYLDPITLRDGSTLEEKPFEMAGWIKGAVYTDYYKYHNIDTTSHIWTNFFGADNLGDHTLLDVISFNVDVIPELNLKDQYYRLVYQSTSMQGTLLTSASVSNNSNSMVYTKDTDNAALYSNGLVMIGVRNGDVKLTKIADYMYKTNTLTGNNLFIDSIESFYGQRGFIPYNGEEIITLDSITGKYSPIDDTDTDGNDTYFSGSGFNIDMTDMQNRAVSYVLPALQISMDVQSSQTDDLTYQMVSNKKELTKPLLYNQFTFQDGQVDHYYTHSLDTTDIKYQTGKKLESTISTDRYTNWFGIATFDNNKADTTWYVTATAYFFPMGIASPLSGVNYLSSTIDMTDNYTVRLYRTQNITFPVYNPTTEVYKGSTIFTIYGYNYSFDGQSIYYLGSGDDTAQSTFACYALGMRFLANSGTEAYFYSPFEKRLYLFTGSNTLQIADSLSREGKIIDSIYSSCEQILYLLTDEGNIIAKSQGDMCIVENVDTAFHFEGTDSGMILANGWNYLKYRLYQTDEEEWLPLEFETEFLGKNDSLFKVSAVDITFFRGSEKTAKGKVSFDCVYDKLTKKEIQDFELNSKTWESGTLKKLRFVPKNNTVKGFRFGIKSDDYIWIASITVIVEEVSQNTNAVLYK